MRIFYCKRHWLWAGLALLLAMALLLALLPTLTAEPASAQLTGGGKKPVYRVDTRAKKIAISFDAAWGADKTDAIMDILDAKGAKATFFVVGFWAAKYPEKVKSIQQRGFELGNHSANHPKMSKLSAEQQKNEIQLVNEKIKELTGTAPKLFRAPFGDYNDTLLSNLEQQEMLCIQWDVDSLDWKEEGAKPLVERVLKQAKEGSIVLFHNNAKYILDALPTILTELQKRGYQIVSIGQLIYTENYYVDSQGVQHKK